MRKSSFSFVSSDSRLGFLKRIYDPGEYCFSFVGELEHLSKLQFTLESGSFQDCMANDTISMPCFSKSFTDLAIQMFTEFSRIPSCDSKVNDSFFVFLDPPFEDCLDEKSTWIGASIRKPYIRSDFSTQAPIFRIKGQEYGARFVVSNTFREWVELQSFTGFSFSDIEFPSKE